MKVSIDYSTQIKQKCSSPVSVMDLIEPATLRDLLRLLAQHNGESFHRFVFDQDNELKPIILLSVNGKQAHWRLEHRLQDGDRVSIVAPIAGG